VYSPHTARGTSLIQVIIGLVIGAFIIGSLGKLMMNMLQSQTGIKRQASFENVKLTLKEVLKGCDFDFQSEVDGAFNSINFKNLEAEKDYFVATNRITAKDRPVIDFGEKLTNGLKVTRLNLMDSGLAPKKEEDSDYYKYIVWLDFEARDPNGDLIKVIEPHIYFHVFADGDGNFSACLPGEEAEEEGCPNDGIEGDETSPHAVGSGYPGSPYLICTEKQFNNIANGTPSPSPLPPGKQDYLKAEFILGRDLDFSRTTSDIPIGGTQVPLGSGNFQGVFDGQGFKIKNFTYTSTGTTGVFRQINNGEVKNLGIENVAVNGANESGGLAGAAVLSTITNVFTSGTVDTSAGNTGGLLGRSYQSIVRNVYSTATVTSGGSQIGGLIGSYAADTDPGILENAFATGNVTGDAYVGGLVGHLSGGRINKAYGTGIVSGVTAVGGAIGFFVNAHLTNVYATGNVFGTNSEAGGLVGYVHGTQIRSITNAFATGDVQGKYGVGGLIGRADEIPVTNVFATGNVTTIDQGNNTGGLVGQALSGTNIINAYATGNVTGWVEVGGLIGQITKVAVINAYAIGEVSGRSRVGGLIGKKNDAPVTIGSITNAFSTGPVTATSTDTGRLIGVPFDLTLTNIFYRDQSNCESSEACVASGVAVNDINLFEDPNAVVSSEPIYQDSESTTRPNSAYDNLPLNHSWNDNTWTFDVPDPNDGQDGDIITENIWQFHNNADGQCLLPTLNFPADMPGEVDLSSMPESLQPVAQPEAVSPNSIQASPCIKQ